MAVAVRPATPDDSEWRRSLLEEHWGSHRVVSRGRLHDAAELPGFVVEASGRRLGLVTFCLDDDQCEIVTLNSLVEGRGIGTAMIAAVENAARQNGAVRLWLITTNDNLRALGFYQRRGFTLVAIHLDALRESRRLKPEIPLLAANGIPIRDEIELERRLD